MYAVLQLRRTNENETIITFQHFVSVVYAWKEKGEGKVKAVGLDLTLRQSVSFPFPFCNWFMKSTLSRKLSYVLFLRQFVREKYMSSLKVNLYSRRKRKSVVIVWWKQPYTFCKSFPFYFIFQEDGDTFIYYCIFMEYLSFKKHS